MKVMGSVDHALIHILKTLKLRQILNLAEGLNDKRIAIRALAYRELKENNQQKSKNFIKDVGDSSEPIF